MAILARAELAGSIIASGRGIYAHRHFVAA
jgi:hypothetical protein